MSQNFGKANNITDIADLGRPDVAALMDSDGNGKGREPAEVAREWAEANPARVDAWLGL